MSEMTSFGIKKPLDQLGRVTIPLPFRNNLGWKPGDMVEICQTENEVVIRAVQKEDK